MAGGNRLHSKAPKDGEEIRPSASKQSARAPARQQPAAPPSVPTKDRWISRWYQEIADSGQ